MGSRERAGAAPTAPKGISLAKRCKEILPHGDFERGCLYGTWAICATWAAMLLWKAVV